MTKQQIERRDAERKQRAKARLQRLGSQAQQAFKSRGEDIGRLLMAYQVQDHQITEIVEFAIGMQAKNPQMKATRIVKKTVEHFKLKLLDEPSQPSWFKVIRGIFLFKIGARRFHIWTSEVTVQGMQAAADELTKFYGSSVTLRMVEAALWTAEDPKTLIKIGTRRRLRVMLVEDPQKSKHENSGHHPDLPARRGTAPDTL